VVPLSHSKLRVFVDINCPLSPCPNNKYLVGKNCGKGLKVGSKLADSVVKRFDKISLRAFNKKN